ncbi:hypothetical protein [Clostridium paraputrificum]|uniref:N-acetyltransferase domain-containing protein n=1 Tax=Clostridium paraputrificum TaxID=29363 RepID=A0A6N3F810_9CLOT
MITFIRNGVDAYKIVKDGEAIGNIIMREEGSTLCIESISLYYNSRNKGIGTEIVGMLKRRYRRIVGESTPFAYKFWERVGAELEFPVNDSMIDKLVDEQIYVPFTIACA